MSFRRSTTELNRHAVQDDRESVRYPAATCQANDVKPIPVEVHQPSPSTLESLGGIVSPLLHPLVTIGIVVIFVIFILLQREDLRDRLIRLAGSHDLQRTTAAIDDAAKSLSKYFLTQAAVNTAFGIVVGVGLYVHRRTQSDPLGTLAGAASLRPYIGSLIAAAMPVLVAAAVDPGWSLAIWTAGLILGLGAARRSSRRADGLWSYQRHVAACGRNLRHIVDGLVGAQSGS